MFVCHGMMCCEALSGAELAEGTLSMEKYCPDSLQSAGFGSLRSVAEIMELKRHMLSEKELLQRKEESSQDLISSRNLPSGN
jgi:predicted nuclease with TOPRIM domain